MTVDIIIPTAGDCVYRASRLSYVASRWIDLGFDVKIGEMDGPWSKASAVANALERSTADVIVVHDSDSWADDVLLAVEAVESGTPWACPFGTVKRLRANVSDDIVAGGIPLQQHHRDALTVPPHKAVPGGGIVVIRRETYDRVPLDPRFVAWGHEDQAWGHALQALVGRALCFPGDLWHLWHPPSDRSSTPERRTNRALLARYAKARRNVDDMRLVVAEARELLSHP